MCNWVTKQGQPIQLIKMETCEECKAFATLSKSWKVMETLWVTQGCTYIFLTPFSFQCVCVCGCVWAEEKLSDTFKLNFQIYLVSLSVFLFFFFANISLAGWFAFRFAVKNKTRNQFVQTIFISKTTYYKLNKFPAMMCEKLNEDWILLYLRFLSIT